MRGHGSGGGGGWGGYFGAPEEKPRLTWTLLRRVLGYSYRYRWSIIAILAMILISTGLALTVPLIMRNLIDVTIPAANMKGLAISALLMLIIPAINSALGVMQRRLNARVGEGVIYELRVALYSHLERMSLRFFTNTRVGELMSRLNNDVVGAQNAVSSSIVNIVTNIVQATAVLIVMLTLEWRLALLSLVIMPLFIFVARQVGAQLRDIAREALELNAEMNAMANETLNIGGALLVKLFGRTDVEVKRFAARSAEVRDVGIRRALIGAVFFAIIGLIGAVGTAAVYGIGGYMVIRGAMTIGTIVAFGAYLGNLYNSLQGLVNAPVDFATSMVSFERVFEVIDLPLDIREKQDAVALSRVSGDLVFDDVSFRYESSGRNMLKEVQRFGQMDNVRATLSGHEPEGPRNGTVAEEPPARSQAREDALDHVSFSVHAGQLVALVGPSGAGKTTLTYLIPRLYDPTEGRILVDGHDLRDVSLESLSAQIGMVTQETYLFHDTIRTNLLYACLDASQQELEEAAKAANIQDFIADLPDRYDTIVGERGYRLSGGERQRIALARVILKDPRILVLDEATSSLDSESEALIQDALKRVMVGRTSIVIAHRLSTILAADLILVIDRGQIVERGTHGELLAQGGLYAHLYATQFNRAAPVEQGNR